MNTKEKQVKLFVEEIVKANYYTQNKYCLEVPCAVSVGQE